MYFICFVLICHNIIIVCHKSKIYNICLKVETVIGLRKQNHQLDLFASTNFFLCGQCENVALCSDDSFYILSFYYF